MTMLAPLSCLLCVVGAVQVDQFTAKLVAPV